MRNLLFALALAAAAAGCGDSKQNAGPAEEEMKAAASRLLLVPEEKITQFTKGKCRTKDKGYICDFEMYIAFGETPSKQDLNEGYFFKSDDEVWVMELVG